MTALLSCHTPYSSGARQSSAEQEILLLSQAYDAATVRGDSVALGRLLADDYVYVSGSGKLSSKADALALTRSKNYKLEFGQSHEVRVRAFGTAAIVTGRWVATGRNNGIPFRDNDRYTSVYIRRDGLWQIVSDHVSAIRE